MTDPKGIPPLEENVNLKVSKLMESSDTCTAFRKTGRDIGLMAKKFPSQVLHSLSEYRDFLEGYDYPKMLRVLLSLWYIAYFYTFVIVVWFSKTPSANYTITNGSNENPWPSVAERAIESVELLAPGSTSGIPRPVFKDVPERNHTYYVYHFGLCRENEIFEKKCYSGKGMLRLLARDLAVQVAESNQVDDMNTFMFDWEDQYSWALEEATKSIRKNTHCSERSLWTLFLRKCVVTVDPKVMEVARELAGFSKYTLSTYIWTIGAFFFFVAVACDAYGRFITADRESLRSTFTVCFILNLVMMVIYLFMFGTPEISLLKEAGLTIEVGYLRSVTIMVLALQMCFAGFVVASPISDDLY